MNKIIEKVARAICTADGKLEVWDGIKQPVQVWKQYTGLAQAAIAAYEGELEKDAACWRTLKELVVDEGFENQILNLVINSIGEEQIYKRTGLTFDEVASAALYIAIKRAEDVNKSNGGEGG